MISEEARNQKAARDKLKKYRAGLRKEEESDGDDEDLDNTRRIRRMTHRNREKDFEAAALENSNAENEDEDPEIIFVEMTPEEYAYSRLPQVEQAKRREEFQSAMAARKRKDEHERAIQERHSEAVRYDIAHRKLKKSAIPRKSSAQMERLPALTKKLEEECTYQDVRNVLRGRQSLQTAEERSEGMYGQADEEEFIPPRKGTAASYRWRTNADRHKTAINALKLAQIVRQRHFRLDRGGRRRWGPTDLDQVINNIFEVASEAIDERNAQKLAYKERQEKPWLSANKDWSWQFVGMTPDNIYEPHYIRILERNINRQQSRIRIFLVFDAEASKDELLMSPGHFYGGLHNSLGRFHLEMPKPLQGEIKKGTVIRRHESDNNQHKTDMFWDTTKFQWINMKHLPGTIEHKLTKDKLIGEKLPLTRPLQTSRGSGKKYVVPAGSVVRRSGLKPKPMRPTASGDLVISLPPTTSIIIPRIDGQPAQLLQLTEHREAGRRKPNRKGKGKAKANPNTTKPGNRQKADKNKRKANYKPEEIIELD